MFKKVGLSTQILLGLIIGAVVGYLVPDTATHLKPIGDAFLRMIKMIVVPLIFSTLIMGIAGTGDFKNSVVSVAKQLFGLNLPRPLP